MMKVRNYTSDDIEADIDEYLQENPCEKTPKLCSYVETIRHNYKGRIICIHHSFQDTRESDEWFNLQNPPINPKLKSKPWVSILKHEEGSILVPISDVKVIEPFVLKNKWETFYF